MSENKDLKQGGVFRDITNLWTRAVQIIFVISFTFLLVSFLALYFVPEFGIMLMGNMSEAQSANMFEIVRVWAIPMLFCIILLAALTIAICRWFYRKTQCIMNTLRDKIMQSHERSLERKAAVAARKKNKE